MKKMIGASSISFALALFFLLSSPALAFLGPGFGQNPGEGGGLFTVDSSKNIGFGTQTPAQTYNFDASSTQSGSIQHGYIFLVASSSNPGIGLRNTSYNSGQAITYLWSVRDFGALQLYREGGALPGKAVFHITPLGKVGVSTFTIDEGVRFQVGDGDIKAPGFQGSGVNLTDIDPTSFIANSAFPSGNFAFPGALAVGTTTVTGLPANGLYVQGNVGIGTKSPGEKLDINGNIRAVGTLYLPASTTETRAIEIGTIRTGNGFSYVDLIGDATYTDYGTRLIRNNSGANTSSQLIHRGTGALNIYAQDAGFITLSTNGSERMRIVSTGEIGIGTTAPDYKLHIAETIANTFPIKIEMNAATLGTNNNWPIGLYVKNTDTTANTISAIKFSFQADSGTTTYPAQDILAGKEQLWTSTASTRDGYLAFRTTLDGNLAERIRINSAGNVGIGTASPITALDVVGEVRAEGASGAFNLISRDGSGTAHSLYNPTGDDVRFWNSIAGDTLTILNGGNVGIRTTSPALSLEVGGTTGAPAITGTAQTGALRIVDKTLTIGNVLDFGIYNSGAYGLWLQGTDRGNLATTYPIILQPNGGNVGIGNTVPGAKLEVTGQVKITGGTPGAGKVLTSDAAGLATWTTPVSAPVTSVFGRTGAVVAASGDYSVAQVTGAAPLASPTFTGSVTMSGNLTLSGTSANIILGSNYLSGDGEDEGIFVHGSTGNIGIGTTGPMAMLSVGIPGASNASISAGGKDYGILANGALVGVRGNGGTYGVYADGAVYDFYAAGIAGKNAFMGDVGIGLSSPEAGLHVNKSGGFRQSSLGEFNIDASGVIGGRMKVTTAGTVYFQNLTTDTATGAFVCIGAAGEIYKKGTVCVGISSLRYKENVTDLTYGLSEVMHLSPKFFTLKKEVFPQSGRRQVGLIAESVYPVIPEVVELDKDGLPESINYDAYTAVLTKAIQEQQVQIQELKSALCGIKPKLELCK